MLIKKRDLLTERFSNIGRTEQLYIIPTIDGLKLLALNLILLVIGLVYANNYVLLFNFILFSLFMGSMYYTHFNLQGLKLISARMNPIHVGDSGNLTLSFKSSSGLGHHFLGIRFNSHFIKIQDKNFSFSFEGELRILKVDIPISATKRGITPAPRICIETLFPFHLFRSFVYFNPHLNFIIYPEKKDYHLHSEKMHTEEKNDEGVDFILKDFKPGDPLKRVYWKKLAQTNRWYSKNLITPDSAPIVLSLSDNDLTKPELEKELCSLCYALHKCHSQNLKYGLSLGKIQIFPDHSYYHLNRCLKALAEYEN